LHRPCARRDLRSFPTRRSSDLLRPASELSQGTGKAQQGKLLVEIAELYENCLGRPEYALRARIAAWRLQGDLPAETGELSPTHADRKSTRLNSSHVKISYAVFC